MTAPSPAGRVVAITGGARGIGLATARALHAAGARVAIGDLDEPEAARAAASIGDDVLGAGLDVTSPASFEQFLALAERELGPLDVLVNNAGIMPLGPFVDETDAMARKVIEVNVLGPMTGMRLALRSMLARGRGHVVNVASAAGKSATPGGLSYCASKAAVVSMTETARVEHRGSGVEFTCVMPSFTQTDLISGTSGTRFIRTVQPEEVAQAIVEAIARPRPDVYVPKMVGGALRMNELLGRRFRDATGRALKADRTFLDVDQSQRAAYDRRLTAGTAPELPPAGREPAQRP